MLPIARSHHFASDAAVEGPLDEVVAKLRSSDFDVRDEATTRLLRMDPNRLPEICSLLAREKDAEAAARLKQVAGHLYLKARTPLDGPTCLLGIKFSVELVRLDPKGQGDLSMSIAVMELQPGYPSAQELRVGDRLIAINGKTFPRDMPQEMFPSLVRAHRAGEVVTFGILRNGKQIEANVQLAGLPEAGGVNLDLAIEDRNSALLSFLAGLETGVKKTPVVVEDKTTLAQPVETEIEIYQMK
jgi:hypothetical protein